ncbi:MAG: hypothetical protein AAGG55_00660 [Pseudomonadota bacterium]
MNRKSQLQDVTTRFMKWLAPLCRIFFCAVALPVSAQNLLLTLATEPPQPNVISTRSVDTQSVVTTPGNRVSFARSSGRDYQLEASGGFFWTQVQEVPRSSDYVALTPMEREDGYEITVEVSRKDGTRRQQYTSTVLAQPGEWLRVLGPAGESRGATTYSTRAARGDALFLKVEPL